MNDMHGLPEDGQMAARKMMLAAYRQTHTIDPVEDYTAIGRVYVCDHDGIRVVQNKDGGWRHDPEALEALTRPVNGVPVHA